MQDAAKAGIQVVVLDRRLPGAPFDSVLVDNRLAARRCVETLLRLGCRRIAFIEGPPTLENARERRLGYEDGLNKAGVPMDPELMVPGDYHRDAGFKQANALLGRAAPPDSIFAANGMMAVGVVEALGQMRRSGRRTW